MDSLWSPEIAESKLGRTASAVRARTWLAGPALDNPHADMERPRIVDREIIVAREAQAHLQTGYPAGALQVLRERKDRTADRQLYRWEAEALVRLGHLAEAIEVVKAALPRVISGHNCQDALQLHLLGASIARAQSDECLLREHARRTADYALSAHDQRSSSVRWNRWLLPIKAFTQETQMPHSTNANWQTCLSPSWTIANW